MSYPSVAFSITSPQDVTDLVADIRSAARRSARNGGEYGVYRQDDNGQYTVAITIQLGGYENMTGASLSARRVRSACRT